MSDALREFFKVQAVQGAAVGVEGEWEVVERFGDPAAEYAALGDGPAVVDRSYRGLLELTGKDRAAWLHNLTTNEVKNLSAGEGNYAFATNVQGRIVFDLNILVRPDAIWIDLDRRFLERARSHFGKYIILEDVTVTDRSDEFVRIGLVGRRSADLLERLGVTNALAMPSLGTSTARWKDVTVPLMRHGFCGTPAVELYVPADRAVEFWHDLSDPAHRNAANQVGAEAVHIRRIEAGIPWPGREVTEDVLPAETGQLERAVSFQKGCYLGQEVVERMRSRGALARRLCGLRIEGDAVPEPGRVLTDRDGKPVGRLTSACRSFKSGRPVALGYVKTASASVGQAVLLAAPDGPGVGATVVEPPL